MKYFIIEGNLKNSKMIEEHIMKEHMSYTQRAMDDGTILMSGLKSDQGGGVFIMKADTIKSMESYLLNEPFYLHGIQDYRYTEFDPHFIHHSPSVWFQK